MKVSQYSPSVTAASSAANDKNLSTEVTVSTTPVESSSSGTTSSYALTNADSTDSATVAASDAELMDVIDQVPAESAVEMSDQVDSQPFYEFIMGLGEDDHAAMKAFHHQIAEAVKGGSLDSNQIADLVNQAPDCLQGFLETQGISAEDFVQKVGDRIINRPPPTELQQEMREFFKSEKLDPMDSGLHDFFHQMFEASRNGDVSGMTDIAPQALQDFADNKGISLSDLIGQIDTDMQDKFSAA